MSCDKPVNSRTKEIQPVSPSPIVEEDYRMIRPPEERRYSPKELAQILRIGVRTLWTWIATGKIPPPIRYTGRCVRWKESQIRDFLDRGKESTAEEALK